MIITIEEGTVKITDRQEPKESVLKLTIIGIDTSDGSERKIHINAISIDGRLPDLTGTIIKETSIERC